MSPRSSRRRHPRSAPPDSWILAPLLELLVLLVLLGPPLDSSKIFSRLYEHLRYNQRDGALHDVRANLPGAGLGRPIALLRLRTHSAPCLPDRELLALV